MSASPSSRPALWKPLCASALVNAILLLGFARLAARPTHPPAVMAVAVELPPLPPQAASPASLHQSRNGEQRGRETPTHDGSAAQEWETAKRTEKGAAASPRRIILPKSVEARSPRPTSPDHLVPAQTPPMPDTQSATTAPDDFHTAALAAPNAEAGAATSPASDSAADAVDSDGTGSSVSGPASAPSGSGNGHGDSLPAAAPGNGTQSGTAGSPSGAGTGRGPDVIAPAAPSAQQGPTRNARVVEKSQPPYPPSARQEGVEGTVTLRVLLDADAAVQRVEVIQSSGDRRLDDAARQEVATHWRFAPRLEKGRPVAATLTACVVFTLTDEP